MTHGNPNIHRLPAYLAVFWLACLIGAASTVSLAQQPSDVLSGRVVDAETGTPIEFGHVFVDGTTLGDVTDAEGRFRLTLPSAQQFRVVVSVLGFQAQSIEIDRNTMGTEPLEIELTPEVVRLDALTVVAERPRHWKRNLERLKRLLFSTTPGGRGCVIENPEVLDVSSDSRTGPLAARARAPLVVANRALGYRVTLHAFHLEGTEQFYNWEGRLHFDELTPESNRERRRWEERRRQAYAGSLRHFLRALATGRLRDEGFEAYLVPRSGKISDEDPVLEMGLPRASGATPILSGVDGEVTRTLMFTGALYVRYRQEHEPPDYLAYLRKYAPRTLGAIYQSSWLVLPSGLVTIDTSGTVFTGGDVFPVTHYGYWAWERLGEMLPSDYRLRR